MNIPDKHFPYLLGQEYSNGLHVDFECDQDDFNYTSRNRILIDLCQHKKVIHVGCIDYIPNIKKRIKRGKWLHEELSKVTERCYGVDIQEEGISYIKNELGYKDVETVDILESDSTEIINEKWDYLLLPEVLEHIDNPFDFLIKVRKKYSRNVGKFVLTVPNAFAKENFKFAKKGLEVIHSDHRYWFTPYTLSKLVLNAGYKIDKIQMCKLGIVKKRSFLKNIYLRRNPLLRNDIVMILDFNN